MKIDLMGCRVYMISPGTGKYRERALLCFQRLMDYGFRHIEMVRSIPDSYPINSLTRTVVWIMERERHASPPLPFIIVEDDIHEMHLCKQLDIPDNADAIYLGLSHWIYPHPYHSLGTGLHIRPSNSTDFTDTSDDIVRIRGMLAGHAILFVNQPSNDNNHRDYLSQCIVRIKDRIPHKTPHDLILAALQHEYPVYALKYPIFFQDEALGGQEGVTRLQWNMKEFNFTPIL